MASQINQPHVCEDCLICYDTGSKLVRHLKTMRHEEIAKHQEFLELDLSRLDRAREKLARKRQKKAEKMEEEILEVEKMDVDQAGTSGVSLRGVLSTKSYVDVPAKP